MKTILLSVAFFAFFFNIVNGKPQEQGFRNDSFTRGEALESPDDGDNFLLVINGKIFNHNYLHALNPSLITNFKLLKGDESIKQYGQAGKFGAVLVELKKGVKWIKVSKILKRSKIDQQWHHLPIVYGDKVVNVELLMTSSEVKYAASVITTANNRYNTWIARDRYILIAEIPRPKP